MSDNIAGASDPPPSPPSVGQKRSASVASDVSTAAAAFPPLAPLDRAGQTAIEHAFRSRMALKNVPAVNAFHTARNEAQRTHSYLGRISTDLCDHIIVPMLRTSYVGVVTTDKPPKIPVQLPPPYTSRFDRVNPAPAYCANRTAALYPTPMLAPLFSYRVTCRKSQYRGECSSCALSNCKNHKFSYMAFDGLHNRASIITAPRSEITVDQFRVALLPPLGELVSRCPSLPKVTAWGMTEPNPDEPSRDLEKTITTACMLPDGRISGTMKVYIPTEQYHRSATWRSRFMIYQPEDNAQAVIRTNAWSSRPQLNSRRVLSVFTDDPPATKSNDSPPAPYNEFYVSVNTNGPAQFISNICFTRCQIRGATIGPSGAWPVIEDIRPGTHQRSDSSTIATPGVTHTSADTTFRLPFREVPPTPVFRERTPRPQALEHLEYTESQAISGHVLFCDADPNPSVFYLMGSVDHVLSSAYSASPFAATHHYCVFVYETSTRQCIKVIHLDVTPLTAVQRYDIGIRLGACHVDGAGNFVLFTNAPEDQIEYGPMVVVWSPTGKFIKKAILVTREYVVGDCWIFLTNDGFICTCSVDTTLNYFCLDDESQVSDAEAHLIMQNEDDCTDSDFIAVTGDEGDSYYDDSSSSNSGITGAIWYPDVGFPRSPRRSGFESPEE